MFVHHSFMFRSCFVHVRSCSFMFRSCFVHVRSFSFIFYFWEACNSEPKFWDLWTCSVINEKNLLRPVGICAYICTIIYICKLTNSITNTHSSTSFWEKLQAYRLSCTPENFDEKFPQILAKSDVLYSPKILVGKKEKKEEKKYPCYHIFVRSSDPTRFFDFSP